MIAGLGSFASALRCDDQIGAELLQSRTAFAFPSENCLTYMRDPTMRDPTSLACGSVIR
jgi:hypothetical protein